MHVIRPVWESETPVPPRGSAEYIATMNYVCQNLNLFEIAIRYRQEKLIPATVFGSWVIWYYNMANAPHFADIWDDVMWDYTPELRDIMHKGVSLSKSDDDDYSRQNKFFLHVADLLECDEIRGWISLLENERRAMSAAKRTSTDISDLLVEWCTEPADADQLASFMVENIDTSYISHGELQSGRATGRTQWSENLQEQLRDEIANLTLDGQDLNAGSRVGRAWLSGSVVAVLIVGVFGEGPKRYAVLEDLVVSAASRGSGIGAACLAWVDGQLKSAGITRVFLESGINNHPAHDFFLHNGFDRCSVVMMKEVETPAAVPL